MCENEQRWSTWVRGVMHRNRDGTSRRKALKEVAIGEFVQLVREPENKHDYYAIAVLTQENKMAGYMPGGDFYLAKHMDEGGNVVGKVIELSYDNRMCPDGLRIEVAKIKSESQTKILAAIDQALEKISLVRMLQKKEMLGEAITVCFSGIELIKDIDSENSRIRQYNKVRIPIAILTQIYCRLGEYKRCLDAISWYESYDDQLGLTATQENALAKHKHLAQEKLGLTSTAILLKNKAKRSVKPSQKTLNLQEEWESIFEDERHAFVAIKRGKNTIYEIVDFCDAYIDEKGKLRLSCDGPKKFREDGEVWLEWDKDIDIIPSKLEYYHFVCFDPNGSSIDKYESLIEAEKSVMNKKLRNLKINKIPGTNTLR